MHIYTPTGDRLKLDRELGRGGEAAILAVSGLPATAAKIYHSHRRTPDRYAKLEYMVKNPPDDPCERAGGFSIAWPREIVYFDKLMTEFAGFLMPLADHCFPACRLYYPPDRGRAWPLFSWRYLVFASRNMASSLASLHDKGYVIGDLNESNVLVRSTAEIIYIDTDSFQVVTSSGSHRCTVGKKEYTPPENQRRNFSTFDRTTDHDCFAFAVLVFQLLMEGRHPFDGVATDPALPELQEQGDKIVANWFERVYATHGGVIPPPNSPPFTMLPDDVRSLFLRCFIDGEKAPQNRPRAVEWMTALDALGESLVTCPKNPQHQFAPHVHDCPWCERTRKLRIADPFPDLVALQAAARRAGGKAPRTRVQSGQPAAVPPPPSPAIASPAMVPRPTGMAPSPAVSRPSPVASGPGVAPPPVVGSPPAVTPAPVAAAPPRRNQSVGGGQASRPLPGHQHALSAQSGAVLHHPPVPPVAYPTGALAAAGHALGVPPSITAAGAGTRGTKPAIPTVGGTAGLVPLSVSNSPKAQLPPVAGFPPSSSRLTSVALPSVSTSCPGLGPEVETTDVGSA